MGLRAVVVRESDHEDDLIKRASLLRNDSVHGTFPGTIRVNKSNNSLIVNGNEIFIIYSNDPRKVNYKQFGIKKLLSSIILGLGLMKRA